MNVQLLDHPLGQHLLAILRDASTEPAAFRNCSRKLTTMLALEATKRLPTESLSIQTPLEATTGLRIQPPLAAVPILRAGMAMLDPVLDLFDEVAVGYIGLERDHETAIAHRYYSKLPPLAGLFVLVLDPMLATGGSACHAIQLVKKERPAGIVMVSVIAAPEGIARLQETHPDVLIVSAALDRELDAQRYIRPGLGDYGDRLYGTF